MTVPQVSRPKVDDVNLSRFFDALVASLQAVIKFLQPYMTPDSWHSIPLGSGWSTFASPGYTLPQYRKTPDGRVHLRGIVKGSGASIGQLPLGYRPPRLHIFTTIGDLNAIARVDVTAAGVLLLSAGAGATYLSLDGISFEVT